MKNPFKGLGGRIKAALNRMKMTDEQKKELHWTMMDNFGDGCFIGGLTLIGAAVVAPVATGPALIWGAALIAAGGSAKFAAWKMKPADGPTLENAVPPPKPEEPKPSTPAKPAGPDFSRAIQPKTDKRNPPPGNNPKPASPQP